MRKIPALPDSPLEPPIFIAHNSPMQMNTNTTDHTQPTIQLTAQLTRDLLDGSLTTLDLCDIHNISLPNLLALIQSPDFQTLSSAITQINQARTQLIESESKPAALETLTRVAQQPTTTPQSTETARKAAAKIYRPTQRKTKTKLPSTPPSELQCKRQPPHSLHREIRPIEIESSPLAVARRDQAHLPARGDHKPSVAADVRKKYMHGQ